MHDVAQFISSRKDFYLRNRQSEVQSRLVVLAVRIHSSVLLPVMRDYSENIGFDGKSHHSSYIVESWDAMDYFV